MASMASMEAPMASLASVAPTALMALASVALVVSRVWVSDLSSRKLSNEMLRFSRLENWLGSSTKQTWVDGGSRSSRRVDVVQMKEELMGSLIWSVVMAWARMASMASMVWMAQGCTDVEVPLVLLMVASNGGDGWWRRWLASNGGVEWWRRLVASMVGVDGGLGSSTQRALTWKSLCVPSGEGDTNSGSLLFVKTHCMMSVAFVHCFVTVCCVSCSTVLTSCLCLLLSQSSFSFVMVVYIMTVMITAELWCF